MSLILILGAVEQTRGIQSKINSFGEQGQSAIPVGIGVSEHQGIRLDLGVWAWNINAVRLSISQGDTSAIQKNLITIKELDDVQSYQRIMQSLAEAEASFPWS